MLALICSGWVRMSKPATVPAPPLGARMPQSMRMVVDLPAPLGPRNPNTSPLLDLEADAIDGHEAAEPLFQVFDDDGGWVGSIARNSTSVPRGAWERG